MTEIWFGKDRYHDHPQMFEWCRTQFGYGPWCKPYEDKHRWGIETAFGNTCFYFRDESDATLFALRWQ